MIPTAEHIRPIHDAALFGREPSGDATVLNFNGIKMPSRKSIHPADLKGWQVPPSKLLSLGKAAGVLTPTRMRGNRHFHTSAETGHSKGKRV
ncbi:MAG: hypothetical protein ACOY3I_05460 [Verrucomicrobiota bacterium]